jgi:acyl-coenzyme A thioesterase PaaI-like protein
MRIWQAQSEIRSPRAELMNAIVSGADAPPPYVVPLRMPRAAGWADGRVWLHWKMDPQLANGAGTAFGGYLAALADHALGIATCSVLAEDESFTTSELQMHYFGRARIHAEVVFTGEDGRIAGKATATQVIIPLAPREVPADM